MSATLTKKRPDLLWHYTNWHGLKGIVLTGKLWASHVSYLNDMNELRHAFKVLQKMLRERPPEKLELDWDSKKMESLITSENFDVCIASFSTNGDDLSQWRGYANPPPGFALGFDKTKLSKFANAADCRLVQCKYDPKEQRDGLRGMVNNFFKRAHLQPEDENRGKRIRSLEAKLLQEFAEVAPEFKSGRFASEMEWRLISDSVVWLDTMEFHSSHSLVVPHYEIPIRDAKNAKETALAAVRIGPNAHMQLLEKSVGMFLGGKGFTAVEIFRSKVPFRNW